jgi:hypothetical protein
MKTTIRRFIVTAAVLAAVALSFNPALAVLGYVAGFKVAAKAVGPILATIIWINPGVHVAPFNPYAGEGEQDAFLNFDVAATDRFYKAGLQPGDFFRFQEGIFQLAYNKNGSALAQGDLVTFYVHHSTLTVTAATADLLTIGAGGMTADALVGYFVFVKTGTGIGQLRRILGNTTTTITVARYYPSLQLAAASSPDAFDTVPVNTDTVSIVGFDSVKKTAGVTENVQGVARGAVTDGQLGIIQVAGPCLAKLIGSTDAVTALGPIVPSSTAGVGKGFTTAGETAAEARLNFGIAFDLYAGATALRHVFLFGNRVIGACAPKIR